MVWYFVGRIVSLSVEEVRDELSRQSWRLLCGVRSTVMCDAEELKLLGVIPHRDTFAVVIRVVLGTFHTFKRYLLEYIQALYIYLALDYTQLGGRGFLQGLSSGLFRVTGVPQSHFCVLRYLYKYINPPATNYP